MDQVGNRCTDWRRQRPPICGPLRYVGDVRAVETTDGVTKTYSWGKQKIVFKNGVVVLIAR